MQSLEQRFTGLTTILQSTLVNTSETVCTYSKHTSLCFTKGAKLSLTWICRVVSLIFNEEFVVESNPILTYTLTPDR